MLILSSHCAVIFNDYLYFSFYAIHFGMRCVFGNAVNDQKVSQESLLTNASFKTNNQLASMYTKELEDFTINDEEIAHYVQDVFHCCNFRDI